MSALASAQNRRITPAQQARLGYLRTLVALGLAADQRFFATHPRRDTYVRPIGSYELEEALLLDGPRRRLPTHVIARRLVLDGRTRMFVALPGTSRPDLWTDAEAQVVWSSTRLELQIGTRA